MSVQSQQRRHERAERIKHLVFAPRSITKTQRRLENWPHAWAITQDRESARRLRQKLSWSPPDMGESTITLGEQCATISRLDIPAQWHWLVFDGFGFKQTIVKAGYSATYRQAKRLANAVLIPSAA